MPPERVLSQLQKMGLHFTITRIGEASSPKNLDLPILFILKDKGKLPHLLRSSGHPREYLVVNAPHDDSSVLSAPVTDDERGIRKEIALSLEDGISALCQYFLQRTAINFQAHRPYVVGQNLIGASLAFQETLDLTLKIATLDVGVYISGETGTGKELIARSIHYLSKRKEHPFVAINCGAFNDELVLSELFGHVKGAYTGAERSRAGLIEQAERGTLFLDEIDSLSTKAQISLLRYLQENEFRSVGSTAVKSADVRVIAASNTPLRDLVSSGQFREDLFYRLDILRLDVPPLRNRGADRQLLCQYFLNRMSRKHGIPPRVLDSSLIAAIDEYFWPGNIRQLENSLSRVFLLTNDFFVKHGNGIRLHEDSSADLLDPPAGSTLTSFQTEKAKVIRRFERRYLCDVLSRTNGNVSRAAKFAHKERTSFIRLMRKHGIDRQRFVASQPFDNENTN